ncbi:MAG: proton-conducting transporter membrane subunit, partial [Pseudomonadota bacterium]
FSIAATLAIAFSSNLFSLFVFYEVLTIATYPLVAHKGTEEAKKGARTYLGILMGASIALLLVAVVWTWVIAGTLDFVPGGILEGKTDPLLTAILLAFFAFGIGKAALMPFHRWLPAAMVAPTPVSALLHAVAVVKAGVFSILKVGVYIFGTDFLAQTGASQWLMWLAAFSILAASLVAITKDNLKARLAYSTVSQLSYITLGVALATSIGVIGGGLHIAMHAFGKITLFMCAGAIYVATHKTNISQMDGLGRVMPVTYGAFFVGALSIIGLPPLGGSWSKWYLMLGAAETGHVIMIGVLMLSSLLNVVYLLGPIARGFYLPSDASGTGETTAISEAPFWCVAPPVFAALGCIVLFFFAGDIQAFLEPITQTTGATQ